MNLTLHLVRHDFARMRPWIAIWVTVLVAPIVVGATLLARSPFGDTWKAPDTLAVINGTQVFVAYLLTVILVHEHPLIGTTQFWLTRPISRRRLFAAKAIGAFLIVALPPLLVGLPWWLWCGFGVADIANVALQALVVVLMIVIGGATIATLTDTLGRALLWTVAFVAMAMFAIMFFTITNSMDIGEVSIALSRSVFAIAAIAVELLLVIVVQFFVRRRRGWWLGGAAAVIAGTLLLSAQWRWSWFELSEPREINAQRVAGVAMKINAAQAMSDHSSGRDPRFSQVIAVNGVITGVDPGLTVSGVGARQRWQLAEGVEISRDSPLDVFNSPFEQPRRRDPIPFRARPALPRSLVARLVLEPAVYDARYWLRFGRLEHWFDAPLGPSGWLGFEAHRARVAKATGQGEDVRLEFVTTTPFWLREAFVSASRFRPWFVPLQHPQYVLIDHETGKLAWLKGQRRHVIVSGVAIDWHDFTLSRSGRNGDVTWSPLPEALKSKGQGLRFAAIGWRTEAQVGRTLKVDRLVVAK